MQVVFYDSLRTMALDPREILLEKAGKQSKASLARDLGISVQALHYLLKGRFQPSDAVLAKLGLERVTRIKRRNGGSG